MFILKTDISSYQVCNTNDLGEMAQTAMNGHTDSWDDMIRPFYVCV